MTPLSHLDSAARAPVDLEPPRFRVERFEHAPAELLLRLSLRVSMELPGAARPLLFVQRDAIEHAYQPLVACTGRGQMKDGDEWLWRGSFAVPPDLASDRRALFALRLRDDLRLGLPLPSERAPGMPESSEPDGSGHAWPYVIRRSALMSVVICQLCLVPAGRPAAALADGASGAGASGQSSPQAPASPTPGGHTEPTPETPPPPTGGATGPAPETRTTIVTGPEPSSTSNAPRAAKPPLAGERVPAPAAAPAVTLQLRQRTSAASTVTGNISAAHSQLATGSANASRGAGVSGQSNVALPPQVASAEAAAVAAELASSAGSAQALAFYRIPPFLLPIYQGAAARYGVPWQILAAINEVETNYGSDLSVSSAGAEGWMQFEPGSWLQYGVDALNAGYADPYNPVDAIFAAGRYLQAAGASTNLRGAIFAYNHSDAYVSSVLLRAKLISVLPRSVIRTLTGLIDAGLPVVAKRLAWRMLAPAARSLSATARATLVPSKKGDHRPTPATPGSSAPLSPTAAGAVVGGATGGAPQLVDLLSARGAPVVAVQDGRIVELGSSRKLGKYIVLRDVHGDVFTYAGLGNLAPSNDPPRAVVGSGDQAGPRPRRPRAQLPLRVGSVVVKGTVLGHVRSPFGAKDGHVHFAIRPAGDPNTVDPRPILTNWTQLNHALHPHGTKGEPNLLRATASPTVSVAKVRQTAGAVQTTSRPLVLSGGLTAAQWDQLIARIAVLPVPKVAAKPSSAAIPDPHTVANKPAAGNGPPPLGG
jgi:membrane-bound lytic murein transglycosylase B